MSSAKGFPTYLILRVLFGVFFMLVGGSKLFVPYQNFLYVIQSYEVFSPPIEEFAARVVPWLEFFLGLFLVLGLWLKYVLMAFLGLLTCFIALLGQAIVRGLPIDSCGCFGDWISVPIRAMIFFDSSLWLFTVLMRRRIQLTSLLSLENYFLSKN